MTINKEFLSELTDEELVTEYLDRDNWNELRDKSESIVWKLCDQYDKEYGNDDDMTMVDEMETALTNEMLERFVVMVQSQLK